MLMFGLNDVYSSPHPLSFPSLILSYPLLTSLPRYFMLMFGLNDVYSLVLGESSEMDEANRVMQMQMGGMMGQQPGFDAAGMYRQVTLSSHTSSNIKNAYALST